MTFEQRVELSKLLIGTNGAACILYEGSAAMVCDMSGKEMMKRFALMYSTILDTANALHNQSDGGPFTIQQTEALLSKLSKTGISDADMDFWYRKGQRG